MHIYIFLNIFYIFFPYSAVEYELIRATAIENYLCFLYIAVFIISFANLLLPTCTTYLNSQLFWGGHKNARETERGRALETNVNVKGCADWFPPARIPPCPPRSRRLFIVTRSLPKCPETALFAPRRKRAACKAALRHRRITAPRSPFSGILKLGSGERGGGDTRWFSFAGFLFCQLQTFLCFYLFIVTEGLQLVRTVPPHSQGFAFLRFA